MRGEWKATTLSDVSCDVSYGYTETATSGTIGPKFLRITDIQGDAESILESIADGVFTAAASLRKIKPSYPLVVHCPMLLRAFPRGPFLSFERRQIRPSAAPPANDQVFGRQEKSLAWYKTRMAKRHAGAELCGEVLICGAISQLMVVELRDTLAGEDIRAVWEGLT